MALCKRQKNKIWLWRAIDGITRKPLGWVIGKQDASTIKQLIDIVDDGKCNFITDEYASYFEHIPEDRHYYGKDLTFLIEQTNSDIRHWLGRFVRRAKSTARSIASLTACISLMHAVQSSEVFLNCLSFFT